MSLKRQYATPVSQKVCAFYQHIIEHVLAMEDPATGELLSGPFAKLPPRKLFADYYDIIQDPISINEIRTRSINTKRKPRTEYCSVERFGEMWELMVENSKVYNDPQSLIVKFAEDINEYVQKELAAFIEKNKKILIVEAAEPEPPLRGGGYNNIQQRKKSSSSAAAASASSANIVQEAIDTPVYSFSETDYTEEQLEGDFTTSFSKIFKYIIGFKLTQQKTSLPLSKPFMELPRTNTLGYDAHAPINLALMDPEIYKANVETPMCFGIIRGRLNHKIYSQGQFGSDKFKHDMELVWNNALKCYDDNTTTINKCATELKQAWEKKWQQFVDGELDEPEIVAPQEEDYVEGQENEDDEEYQDYNDNSHNLDDMGEETGDDKYLVDNDGDVDMMENQSELTHTIAHTPPPPPPPQFIRKHQEPLSTYALTSLTIKSSELNKLELVNLNDRAYIDTIILAPNGKDYTVQFPSEAIINQDLLVELRLHESLATGKFQVKCSINEEQLVGTAPSEKIVEATGSFLAESMPMRIGYGMNLLQWEMTYGDDVTEQGKLWINVTN